MIISKVTCLFMFISLTYEFHLHTYPLRTSYRRSSDQVAVRRQSDAHMRLTSPIGQRKTAYRARYPMYVQLIKPRNKTYQRRPKHNRTSFETDFKNGRGKQMPRRSNSFTVRNPKKSALVSDTNLQKLSTYSRRSLRHSKRGRTVNKGNSQSHDTVTKIDIVFPRVERQLSKRNHETRLIPGMGVVRPTPSLPPVSTAKKFFTDFVFPDTKVKSVHMQLDKNIIGKDTKQTNHNGIKKTELMPVETNGSVKLDQVKQKLQDVLAITDENVRKDGMKKLVKSIVSDGGITIESGTVDGISDISTLENIMGLITDISANLKHNSNASTTMDLSIQNVMPKLPKHDSSDITRVSKIGSLQDVPNIIVKGSSQIMDSDKTHIVSPKSSQSLKHLAGMSIFGDTGLPVTNTRSLQEGQGDTMKSNHQPLVGKVGPEKMDLRKAQGVTTIPATTPLFDFSQDTADSFQYWGHLTAGLANMLCSYCTQRGFERCIKTHCNRAAS